MRARDGVGAGDVRPDRLDVGSALCLAKAQADQHRGDACDQARIVGGADQQQPQKQDQTCHAHRGKPPLREDRAEARKGLRYQGFHSALLCIGRVDQRGGVPAPSRTYYGAGNRERSTYCGFLASEEFQNV